MKALSVRQPWAFAILHLGKPVENRPWSTNYRGPILIHAAMRFDMHEIASVRYVVDELGGNRLDVPWPPPPSEECKDPYLRGGIVGRADLVDVVTDHPSPWFFGPYGFVLEKAAEMPFRPMKGRLGLFEVDQSRKTP